MGALNRQVLLAAIIVLGSGGSASAAMPGAAEYASALDALVASRSRQVPSPPANEHGGLAWGEAAYLNNCLSGYEATGKQKYLEHFLKRAHGVLRERDSVSGARDWEGRSLPAWSAGGKYTLGRVELKDTSGRVALVAKTIRSSQNNATRISLRVEGEGYLLTASNAPAATHESHRLLPDLRSLLKVNAESKLIRLYPKSWPSSKAALAEVPDTAVPVQRMVFSVHTGMIAAPLARFAAIVRQQGLTQFKRDASLLARAAADAVAVHENEWTKGQGGAGWYSYTYGSPTLYDNCACPNNYTAAMGRVFIYLNRYRPSRFYQQRIKAIARGIRQDMTRQADGSIVWHYWQGKMRGGWKFGEVRSAHLNGHPGNPVLEDSSHGAIDVQFICMAYNDRLAFTSADMDALALTLEKKVVQPDCTFARILDGSGGTWSIRPGWASLVPLRPYLKKPLSKCLTPLHWLEQFPVGPVR